MKALILFSLILGALVPVTISGALALDQLVFFLVLGAVVAVLAKGFVEGMRDVGGKEGVGE